MHRKAPQELGSSMSLIFTIFHVLKQRLQVTNGKRCYQKKLSLVSSRRLNAAERLAVLSPKNLKLLEY